MKKTLMVLILLFFATVSFAVGISTSIGHERVPSQNSSDNVTLGDVIGNKTDDESGNSIYAKLYESEKHIHSPSKCYPSLANGITLAGGAGAWEQGNYTQIVPANTIASPFDIHWLNIGTLSAADTYEIHLYYGATSTEAGCIRFTRPAGALTNSQAVFQSPLIPANSQVVGRIASSTGGADTGVVSIHYHTY